MSSTCNHDCSKCSSNCADRKESFRAETNELSTVKKVIGIVSGKGGVGKSLVTSTLAVLARRKGQKTAIMDADITGPSIPKAFNLKTKAEAVSEKHLMPVTTKTGIEVMSINLLIEDENKPVIWRGPVLAGTVKQFWTDVIWGEIDVMFIDMPPGTGDVPLTVFQSIPLDGIIIVTSPQELVTMIVAKAVAMAKLMNIPILGIVENMSYFECPKCGERVNVFGESHVEETAKKFDIPMFAKIPINPNLASQSDRGLIELFEGDFLNEMSDYLDTIGK